MQPTTGRDSAPLIRSNAPISMFAEERAKRTPKAAKPATDTQVMDMSTQDDLDAEQKMIAFAAKGTTVNKPAKQATSKHTAPNTTPDSITPAAHVDEQATENVVNVVTEQPTKPTKAPKVEKPKDPAKVAKDVAALTMSKLDKVLAAQAQPQGRNVKRVLLRAHARIAAGQSAEAAVDAVLAQLRAAVLAALASGATPDATDEE